MKNSFLKTVCFAGVLMLALSSALPAHAEGKAGWLEDQTKALEKAKTDKKMVLMDFTGSDWCSWCQKMDKDVFSDPEFMLYAQDNLVLLELDFPRVKPLNPEIRKQNEALSKQYNVEGFPTFVLLDAEGKAIKTFVGYQAGGAKAFIEQLKQAKG